jgi:hypothetical protein
MPAEKFGEFVAAVGNHSYNYFEFPQKALILSLLVRTKVPNQYIIIARSRNPPMVQAIVLSSAGVSI